MFSPIGTVPRCATDPRARAYESVGLCPRAAPSTPHKRSPLRPPRARRLRSDHRGSCCLAQQCGTDARVGASCAAMQPRSRLRLAFRRGFYHFPAHVRRNGHSWQCANVQPGTRGTCFVAPAAGFCPAPPRRAFSRLIRSARDATTYAKRYFSRGFAGRERLRGDFLADNCPRSIDWFHPDASAYSRRIFSRERIR